MPPSAVGTNSFAGQATTHVACRAVAADLAVDDDVGVLVDVEAGRRHHVVERDVWPLAHCSAHPNVLHPAIASRARSRRRSPRRLALGGEDAAQARLGLRVVDAEHRLDDAGDELRVEVLHAVGQHELGRPAQLAVVAQHERRAQPALVAGQPGALRSPAASASTAASPAAMPLAMAKLTPSSQMPAARHSAAASPATSMPVGGHLRHHRQPGLGDEVRRVLLDLAALDERGDGRVRLERRR